MNEYPANSLESMYPEFYQAIYPLIFQSAEQYRGQPLTPYMVDAIVQDIMWRGGLSSDDQMEEAVPAAVVRRPMPRPPQPGPRPPMPGPRPPRPPMPGFRPGLSVNDLIRILLLRELIGR